MSACTCCGGKGWTVNTAWLTLAHHVDIDEMTQEELAHAFIDHGYADQVLRIRLEGGRTWYMLPDKMASCPVCEGLTGVEWGASHHVQEVT